jgi:hypothetical protein
MYTPWQSGGACPSCRLEPSAGALMNAFQAKDAAKMGRERHTQADERERARSEMAATFVSMAGKRPGSVVQV